MIIILLSAFKNIIYLILLYNDSFSVTMNAYIVKLFNFSYLIITILITVMFWSVMMWMWLLMQLYNVINKRMCQWLMKTVLMNLIIIL